MAQILRSHKNGAFLICHSTERLKTSVFKVNKTILIQLVLAQCTSQESNHLTRPLTTTLLPCENYVRNNFFQVRFQNVSSLLLLQHSAYRQGPQLWKKETKKLYPFMFTASAIYSVQVWQLFFTVNQNHSCQILPKMIVF